ncbi:hypothetical protein LP417_02270 [Polaromonas sp. P1-6]|nr:hypothetical protein LP417_02270 [Polaromonas sp. P1-6]UUZ68869.1 hypothetical protein LP416_03095 [Polaromonas sp. P2-4]
MNLFNGMKMDSGLVSSSGSSNKPGLAPAGDLLFFASPKKPKEKKGEPKSGPLRGTLRCSGGRKFQKLVCCAAVGHLKF